MIQITDTACNIEKITIEEVLLLELIDKEIKITDLLKSLQNKELIDDKSNITKKGKIKLKEIYRISKTEPDENKQLLLLAKKLKELFPKGKKTDSIYWSESVYNIANRLKTFLSKYRIFLQEYEIKYNKSIYDLIEEATIKYVDSFNNDKTYMKVLKYFIFKNTLEKFDMDEPASIINTSELLTIIDNLDNNLEKENNNNSKLI